MATAVRGTTQNLKNDFLTAITQLAAEKNLPKEVIFEAVEAALASAFKKDDLADTDLVVRIDGGNGGIRVYARKTVVEVEEDIADPKLEIDLDAAKEFSPTTYVGDVHKPDGTFVFKENANSQGSNVGKASSQIIQNGQFVSGNNDVGIDQTTTPGSRADAVQELHEAEGRGRYNSAQQND